MLGLPIAEAPKSAVPEAVQCRASPLKALSTDRVAGYLQTEGAGADPAEELINESMQLLR